MRIVAVIFFVLAIAFAVDAARDQYRGIAEASAPRMGLPAIARKQDDPASFRGLIGYEWLRVALCLGAGLAFRSIGRTSRRLDPFATDRS